MLATNHSRKEERRKQIGYHWAMAEMFPGLRMAENIKGQGEIPRLRRKAG